MGIAGIPIEKIQESAQVAASHQWGSLDKLRMDVGLLEVRPILPEVPGIPTSAVVAADAGQVSVALAPFHLELLHVTDDQGKVYLTEFFPLTTVADDLRTIFESNPVLSNFTQALGIEWSELTDLWLTPARAQPPMPRDVRLVAETLREIAEWAVSMTLAMEEAPDTGLRVRRIVLRDGTLRSILMRESVVNQLLPAWWRGTAWERNGTAIVGVAKSSAIWQRLALSLSLDARVRGMEKCYILVPKEMEAAALGRSSQTRLGFGRLALLKWRRDVAGQFLPVDLPDWIIEDRELTDMVMSRLLSVSQTTFPQPGYPSPLQRAHESARLSEFESKVLRDILISTLSRIVPEHEFEPMLRYWSFATERWQKTGRIGKS